MQGICFIEPLFYKVVEETKSKTRRMIVSRTGHFQVESQNGVITGIWQTDEEESVGDDLIPVNPRYKVGEIVYLKEPYVISGKYIIYKFGSAIGQECDKAGVKWKNKLFMPESAARYFIEIIGVRAERLQDISEEDCLKEGIVLHQIIRLGQRWFLNGLKDINNNEMGYETPQKAYADLIDKINGKGTWERNPYVWVYDFKLIK